MIIHEAGVPNGPKVLLLHPPLLSGEAMLGLCEGLQDECRLIAPDMSGHGENHEAFAGLAAEADRLAAALAEAGHDRLTLVFGASMGATVAVYLAARAGRDPRVSFGRMVCEGTTMFPVGSGGMTKRLAKVGIRTLRKKLAKMTRDEAKEQIAKLLGPGLAEGVDAFAEMDPKLMDALVEAAFRFDYPPIDGDVQRRIYMYWGSKEPQSTHRLFDERRYPNVHFEVREGLTHCEAFVRDREAYVEMLRGHVRAAAAEG